MSTANMKYELAALLNKMSAENASNTPDFILANYLISCLAAFETAVNTRENWWSEKPGPGTGDVSYLTFNND